MLVSQAYRIFDTHVWLKGSLGVGNAAGTTTRSAPYVPPEAVDSEGHKLLAPPSKHAFPNQDKTYEQDQLSAMDFLWKAELHSFTAPEMVASLRNPSAVTPACAGSSLSVNLSPGALQQLQANDTRWLDILHHVKFPTAHYDPLFDVLVLHALGRCGWYQPNTSTASPSSVRYTVEQMISDIEQAVKQTGDPQRRMALEQSWLPVCYGVAAADRGEFDVALRHLQPVMDGSVLNANGVADSSSGASVAVLGGSCEQREVLHELYVRCLLAQGRLDPARAYNAAAKLPIPIPIAPVPYEP